MKAISIMYHDVVEHGAFAASGFSGADADIYKLDRKLFADHLDAISEQAEIQPVSAFDLNRPYEKPPVLITFDDGGRSAYSIIADDLEKHGWRGHFFVATDFIDTPSFLSETEIRELDRRGHIIGSHSASHPLRMSSCSGKEMLDEWNRSLERLSQIIGRRVKIASVPGGHFSGKVAETAAECGVEILFNSEPVANIERVGNCTIIGRYTIRHKMTARETVEIASGKAIPRLRQYVFWNAKKIAKKFGGKTYLTVRERLLAKDKTD